MNRLQSLIYNKGERLVPYVSHGEGELIRHRSSYAFFYAVIASDLQAHPQKNAPVSIIDLGFGSGYGCALLSSLPFSNLTGVDIEAECETFAHQYYPRSNVDYLIKDLSRFVPNMSPYDYVVSRGVFEHIPNGIDLIKDIKFKNRVMIDVPYNEVHGNEHHVLTGIREGAFSEFEHCELFYEGLDGSIYDASCKPDKPNMIMFVLSSPNMPKISTLFSFPIAPVLSNELEVSSRINLSSQHNYFDSAEELISEIKKAIKETEVVMDIGCGVSPMNYFRPKFHFLVEPWKEYTDVLSFRHSGDKSTIIIRANALDALHQFAPNSVDSIFLLDVIEHIEKDEGYQIIHELERVAREQIVIFTPLGFMPQHIKAGESDGWGLSGAQQQEHLSGWVPKDFSSAWSCYICKKFHQVNHQGQSLKKPFGAFFAVRNFEHKTNLKPEKLPSFYHLSPIEKTLNDLQTEHSNLKAYCAYLEESNKALLAEHQQLLVLSQQQQAQLTSSKN